MEATLRNDGFIFVKGVKPSGSFLRPCKKPDWFYTTWHWYDELKTCEGWNTFELAGVENLEKLSAYKLRILKAIEVKSILQEQLLDKFFKFPLWKPQKHAASLMAASKAFYLADDVGLGKTLSAFAAFVLLKYNNKAKTLCIVCTTSVKHQWKIELERAINDEYRSDFTFSIVHGDKKKREERYAKKANIYIVNYESLRMDARADLFANPIDCVILDEAWKIKSSQAKINRSMKIFFADTTYKFALNASPISNGYEDIFGVMNVIDPNIFINWSNFKDRYCKYIQIKLGHLPYPINKLVGYKRVPELRSKVKHLLLRRTVNDMNWPNPQILVIPYWVELTPRQRVKYNAIKNDPNKSIASIVNARVACLIADPIHESPKYKELLIVLKERVPTDKVIVFTESLTFISLISPFLLKEGISFNIISGEDNSEKRELKKLAFANGNTRVLLMTAAGEAGINLQAADVVVNMDFPWNPERLRQRVGRLRPHLGGAGRTIRVINILTKDTIEENVVDKIQKKIGNFARLFQEEQLDLTGIFEKDNLQILL